MRAVALLAVLGAGCLGDDDEGAESFIAISEIEAAHKDAECAYLARCGVFPDKPTCVAAQFGTRPSGYSLDASTAAAVAAGRAIYNGNNVNECFEALAARSCDKTDISHRVTPAPCQDFVRGTLGDGESCAIDAECASGWCSGQSTQDSCVVGVCMGDAPFQGPPAPVGAACGSFNGCEVGGYCDAATGLCVLLKPTGAACSSVYECAYGLACLDSGGTRTCEALPALGESCATDFVCRDEGAYCDSTTTLCTQVRGPGSTCSTSSECSPYYPCSSTSSTCTKGPATGQSCGGSTGSCADAGTYCDFTTRVCTPFKANGMACEEAFECTSFFCTVDPATGMGTCSMPMVCSL